MYELREGVGSVVDFIFPVRPRGLEGLRMLPSLRPLMAWTRFYQPRCAANLADKLSNVINFAAMNGLEGKRRKETNSDLTNTLNNSSHMFLNAILCKSNVFSPTCDSCNVLGTKVKEMVIWELQHNTSSILQRSICTSRLSDLTQRFGPSWHNQF